MLSDVFPMRRLPDVWVERILEEDRIQLVGCRVLDELSVWPAHCPQAIGIQADRNGACLAGGPEQLAGRNGSKGGEEEIPAVQRGLPNPNRITGPGVGQVLAS